MKKKKRKAPAQTVKQKPVSSPFLGLDQVYNILLILILAVYVFLLFRFSTIGEIAPHDWDESLYYQSSIVFSENNSLKASIFIEELVSKIFESDYYGPLYPIFFGSWCKLMGNAEKSFIYTNFILLALSMFVLYKMTLVSTKDKKWIALVLLLGAPVLNYAFYFMPCILELVFAGILIYYLLLIQQKKDGQYGVLLFQYCCLTIIISFFKQNFILFLFGILPYSKNKVQFLLYTLSIFLGIFITKLYASYFAAPAFAEGLKAFDHLAHLDFSKAFSSFIKYAGNNLKYLFNLYENLADPKTQSVVDGGPSISYYPIYFVLFGSPIIALFLGYTRKNKLLLAFGLIVTITLSSYIFMYHTNYYYLIRITIPLLLLNFIVITLMNNRLKNIIQISLLVILILLFPTSFAFVNSNQDLKKEVHANTEIIKGNFSSLSKIGIDQETTTVLFDPAFYDTYNTLEFLLALPLASDNGNRIRYTVNYRLKDRFSLLGKITVDYILSPFLMNFENASLVEQTPNYYLYQINK
ncbi:hypothetical protein JYT59_00880 [Sphingobacteriaceae bacterium AH-315-L07]|nr:hypothetical protein [Sphingobacteriaceae bacterium AH-315-L07]